MKFSNLGWRHYSEGDINKIGIILCKILNILQIGSNKKLKKKF